MMLVERHFIKSNHAFYQECDQLSFLAKNLYNAANYIYRQNFFTNQKTEAIAVYHQLKNSPDYKFLPAKVAQEVLRMLFKSWQSYYSAYREYLVNPTKFKAPPKIPNYKGSVKDRNNDRYVVSYNNQAFSKKKFKKGIIHLSKTNIYLKTQVKKAEQVRIIPKKNAYIIEVVYKQEINENSLPKNKIASIDLGLNNLVTLSSNSPNYQPKIYDGRALKAVNQYVNKETAKLQSHLKETRITKRISKIWQKRNQKMDYYLHCTSKAIIAELVRNQIGTLIIGWNRDFKDSINIGKVNNQKFVNIPHKILIEQLKYKGLLAGIEVKLTEESYTSKCSALELEPLKKHENYLGKRIKRGLFKTSEGKLINADLNGSLNIGRKVLGNDFIVSSHSGCVVQPLRIRPYQQEIW
jgi:putative transposase